MPRRRVVVASIIAGVVALLTIVAIACGLVAIAVLMHSPYSTARHLEYDGYTFNEDSGNVAAFTWDKALNNKLDPPPIYLRLEKRPGEVFFAPKLTEDFVASVSDSAINLGNSDDSRYTMYALNNEDRIIYSEGKMVGMSIINGSTEISLKREGPFVRLPAKLGDVIKVFGKPLRYKRLLRRYM